jgi:high affinity sulfate transporter 1
MTATPNPSKAGNASSSRLAQWFPPLRWLPTYERAWLPRDAIAGVTLAAYAIPVSLAYATLAGLPPQHGVYCYLVAGLAYTLFGTSRQLAIGPTSAISMLVGATVAGMAAGDAERWIAIASLTAGVVAATAAFAWAFRLSSLVNFISETVLTGFKAGAALTIAMTQLPKLFGVKGGGEHFFERAWTLAGQLPDTNLVVATFGIAAILLLVGGERLLPGRPVALAVVVLAIVALSATPLGEAGFKTVGLLPEGLPAPTLPALGLRDVDGVVPLAFACFLLAYIEGISAARALARRHGDEVDARQELLALGACNLATAFGQGYPVAGGLSQSTVNDRAGARTPLALVFASVAIGLCLAYLTGLIRNLPDVVLAAIVLVAVKGLVNVAEIRRIARLSRTEFAIVVVAFAGVLVLGILKGVLLAAAVSLALVIRGAAHPRVAVLGRVPGTSRYSDLERSPDNTPVAGALLLRVESGLLYFNALTVRDEVRRLVASAGADVKRVLWDLSSSPAIDVGAATMIAELERELAGAGIALVLVDARSGPREILARTLERPAALADRRVTLDEAVRGAAGAPQ